MMLLAGSIGYILGGDNSGSSSSSTSSDNKKVLKEIEELKTLYDLKIADKTNTYNALEAEKKRVNNLVLELEKTKGDASSLLKYKTEYKNLESKMMVLVNEIVVLKSNKSKVVFKNPKVIAPKIITTKDNSNNEVGIPKSEVAIVKKIVPTTIKIENTKLKSDDIFSKIVTTKEEPTVVKNEVIKSAEKKYSKVTLSNVKAGAFISKSSVKQIETNSSGKANLIKINFTLDENSNAKSGEKMYYFQIINGKNNVLGKRITEFFDNESLTYSFKKSFDYNNESVSIVQEFLQSDFESGTYYVTIFDRNELVGKSTFILK